MLFTDIVYKKQFNRVIGDKSNNIIIYMRDNENKHIPKIKFAKTVTTLLNASILSSFLTLLFRVYTIILNLDR